MTRGCIEPCLPLTDCINNPIVCATDEEGWASHRVMETNMYIPCRIRIVVRQPSPSASLRLSFMQTSSQSEPYPLYSLYTVEGDT